MFNSITGIIREKLPQKVYIETNGIEWDINIPESSLAKLPAPGNAAKVYVWLQHTDVLMTLYGFADTGDRSLFFELLKVDGVGPKGALKIMGSVSSSELIHILDDGNVELLQKVPGVGKKTAAKMLLQLKGKLTLDDTSSRVKQNSDANPYADIINGLSDMGYDRHSVEDAIKKILSELETDEAFKNMNTRDKEQTLFQRALMELA
ncbi:MAG: Holliday junction branch migration protein RuvA [Treponema sp.]|nr:Holliday junction branch migration protein RuvA [Treponema sp.]